MVGCRFRVKCQMVVDLWQNQCVWVVDLVSARVGHIIFQSSGSNEIGMIYNYDLYDL
jgi:hypothetical protein